MGFGKELLILGFVWLLVKCDSPCESGDTCPNVDVCGMRADICGNNAMCLNTNGSYVCQCMPGYKNRNSKKYFQGSEADCQDINECQENKTRCGPLASCINTQGNYTCECKYGYTSRSICKDKCIHVGVTCNEPAKKSRCPPGFVNRNANVNFAGSELDCQDINECQENRTRCGPLASCINTQGNYTCECKYGSDSDNNCKERDECEEAKDNNELICGEKGTCEKVDGSYWCKCPKGYSNYGNKRTPCSKLDCEDFGADRTPEKSLGGLADIISMMRNSCLALSDPNTSGKEKPDGSMLLEKLFTATEQILSPGPLNSSKSVSRLLDTVERSILLVGPQLKENSTNMETTETDAQIKVQRGKTPPTGPIFLTAGNASLRTDWESAAGVGTYRGFAMAALLSYKNLEGSVNKSFQELGDVGAAGTSFQVFSKVVSIVVSNPFTQNLTNPVTITFKRLQAIEESPEQRYNCAYWKESGAWSTDGCSQQSSNQTHTVCTWSHLSSFAVLMALHPMKPVFALELLTRIGLIISLVCLSLSILTFRFCRSIQSTRTTIHMHLCVSLFVADLVFLAGISRVKPEGGCKFVAFMLHYFFLAVFTWMLLEGVQLYRMIVLVFNATMRPLYLYLSGYGVPLAIVTISVISRPGGYGTRQHCWLSLDDGLMWSFFGPVCVIILVNVLFFILTVWKLSQKFSTLNPDLSKLHKIRAFTVTAIAQMCILGLMWVFGAFLFQEGTAALAYIFTILNSLQGALIFIMHCLLSKQVREDYTHLLSCICTPKKRYSDLSSTNPSSSQSQGFRSGHNTGESPI